MSTENVHEEHPWFKLPRWKKRLHGWASYQMSAWIALFFPEAVDVILYNNLKEQFKKTPKDFEGNKFI